MKLRLGTRQSMESTRRKMSENKGQGAGNCTMKEHIHIAEPYQPCKEGIPHNR